MNYRKGLTGFVSKPPCGAVFHGVELSDKVKSSSYWIVAVVIVWYGYWS
ncbi:MAG: hypothetical protein WAT79_01255 [Saprospiraceae bacterium]